MAGKRVKTYIVNTPVFGVNLRAEPNGKVLDKVLPNGTAVKEKSAVDGWVEVDGGWIRAAYLR